METKVKTVWARVGMAFDVPADEYGRLCEAVEGDDCAGIGEVLSRCACRFDGDSYLPPEVDDNPNRWEQGFELPPGMEAELTVSRHTERLAMAAAALAEAAGRYHQVDGDIETWLPFLVRVANEYERVRGGGTGSDTTSFMPYAKRRILEKAGVELKKWYFTFGSDPGFPYQDGYVTVYAETAEEAIGMFRSRFPDRTRGVINCAFLYPEGKWTGQYPGEAPFEEIF